MKITEAKAIIYSKAEVAFGTLVIAAGVIASPENDEAVTLVDILQCLRNARRFPNNNTAQEYAALALYRRTARLRKPGHAPYEDFDVDADSWELYLKKSGLI